MYAWEDKIKALVLLKENKFNVDKTAKEFGANRLTIMSWRDKYAEIVYKDLEARGEGLHLNETYDAALTEVAQEIKTTHKDFISNVLETKIVAIDKIKKMLPDEKNLDRVNNVLKTLHDITIADSHGEDRSEERRVGKECRSRGSPYH